MTDKELKAKVVEAKALVIADGRPANADNIVSYFFSRIPGARASGATREEVLAAMKPGKKATKKKETKALNYKNLEGK